MSDECGMMNEEKCAAFNSSFIIPHSSFPSAQTVLHDDDGEQDNAAQNQLPPGADPAFEVEDVEDEREQEDADERRADAALPSRQKRPADDDRRDGVQLPPRARDRLPRPQSRREHHAPAAP